MYQYARKCQVLSELSCDCDCCERVANVVANADGRRCNFSEIFFFAIFFAQVVANNWAPTKQETLHTGKKIDWIVDKDDLRKWKWFDGLSLEMGEGGGLVLG